MRVADPRCAAAHLSELTGSRLISLFTKEIREAFVGGELSTTISPRGSVALCQYFLHMKDLMPDENSAMKSAVEAVITDRAPMDSKQRVVEIAQRCFQ